MNKIMPTDTPLEELLSMTKATQQEQKMILEIAKNRNQVGQLRIWLCLGGTEKTFQEMITYLKRH